MPAARKHPVPPELLARLEMAGREVSASTIAFHTALAERRGLSPSDTKAIDILMRRGPLTHAELQQHTALAPASVTDLIDRVERKGLVSRSRHPDDGRRILISANADKIFDELAPLFADWVGELHAIYDGYSDEQLELIAEVLHRMATAQQQAASRLAAHRAAGDGT